MTQAQEIVQNALNDIIGQTPQYKFGKITITAKPIQGRKVGYAGGSKKGKTISGYIVIDTRFVEYANESYEKLDELLNTVRHELAHLIAETINTKKKHVWHGKDWKDIFVSLGGDGSRYYTGSFVKPGADKIKTMAELYATLPSKPATEWEDGTYRQWLERGYHVVKGQKGSLRVWQFSANEYETTDGETSEWGRASAVYFTNDQVEPNQPKTI